ncbi:DUF1116 domain-containing protein [Mycolicibacterium iranicum]|uniref:YahG/YlbE-like protein n=1 Tax=Mycolicibacterium iranicum TaxID=912594 RepID=A0A1X1WNZ3_MYCIR|nr:DUF1116 domain-containing protein [Mycolicibacterium iranicum]ORV88346.1 hypothetical protein AWC12_14170 [Mycolicibacterium iranicum]
MPPAAILEETRAANDAALARFAGADPVLVDVLPAREAIPAMHARLVLTSGPTMPWPEYSGGQRTAILGSVVHEGLAADLAGAEVLLDTGEVTVVGCQDHGCIGSLAGVTSASMPALIVEDRPTGLRSYCTLFEGETPSRLNYGVWNAEVHRNLRFLAESIGPALGKAIRDRGGVALLPIMARALRQGDELHSRNTAASLLFVREILPSLAADSALGERLVTYLTGGDYFFLRPAMAAAKVMAARMAGVPGSSIVTAMAMSCSTFGIQVSGIPGRWFTGPLPHFEHYRLSPGVTIDDAQFMGGESITTEVCGLGAFAQTAAFTLQDYQGGVTRMIELNEQMYQITHGESPFFRLPYLGFRGTPTGIDAHAVADTGITPVMDIGIAGAAGGQIGAGIARAPLGPFTTASEALLRQSNFQRTEGK